MLARMANTVLKRLLTRLKQLRDAHGFD